MEAAARPRPRDITQRYAEHGPPPAPGTPGDRERLLRLTERASHLRGQVADAAHDAVGL